MLLLVLCILTLKLKPSMSLFPQHTDLQKVGEVVFNNEKYNVLKVTTHTVTDYFEDFMLGKKRENAKRLFVDDNSFRHQWSGFNEKPQSLRKTEILKNTFYEVVSDNVSNENNNPAMLTSNTEKKTETSGNGSVANKAVRSNSDNVENAASNENSLRDTNINSTAKEHVKTIERIAKGKPAESSKPAEKERSVVKTTFFCPFIGIITMSAFVD